MSALTLHPQNDVDLEQLRHSTAHVLAGAVTKLFPGAKLAIGPAIDDGFYYDFQLPRTLTPDDLQVIETHMREIVGANHPFVSRTVSVAEARVLFHDQPYKLEILDELERKGAVISTYRHDTFEDLCRGPHLAATGQVPPDSFRLTHISGAYWRGNEQHDMLQRIYGTVWTRREDLEAYLWRIEEARRRDHRKLGRDLDLFSISEEVGPGLVLWHPKGATVRLAMEDFLRRMHLENGYEWVFTPHIGRARLWETSGHLHYFRDTMYPAMKADDSEYFARPMNCPFHAEIFKSRPSSYRELPRRLVENGAVYRYERSGVLHGLTRARGFTQDDAHIFCRPDQIEDEIERAVGLALSVFRAFGLSEFHAELSTKPDKAVGEDDSWCNATDALRCAAERHALPWRLDEGGGAFYGPKLSLILRDAIGRDWQCSTIQFDFNLPQRFDLEYTGEDGKAHRPYMVHRALMGSIERFFGILIEHHAGAFPLWLAPVQGVVIPVSAERHTEYARQVANRLRGNGFRAEVDDSNERMQAKIRRAQVTKVPYMLVVGEREREKRTVSVRPRSGDDLGTLSMDALITHMQQERDVSFQPNRAHMWEEENDVDAWTGRCC